MPYVTVKMLKGRTEEQKKALVEKVTDAVVETTGASKEKVTVFIEEMANNHYEVGGNAIRRSIILIQFKVNGIQKPTLHKVGLFF